MQKAFGRAARHIHNKKGYKPEMLTDEPVRELIEATNKALVEPLHRLALNEEVSFDLQTALEQNTFVFSGFKTHHELTEAAQLLKGDDGRFKPFSQFRTDIQALNQNYNGNYLRAEYNFATASTQMAAKWQQWAEDGDEYNLQYRTANDDRVREEHAALHGTTLPPSDPFWDSYLPPNGWNCRCTAVQVLKYKYPESDSAKAIAAAAGITDTPKKQIFRFNPGKQMKVFPPKHPYLPKGCGNCNRKLLSYDPNSPACQACKAIAKCLERAPQLRPETVKTYKNGGQIDVYKNIDRDTDDYKRIYASADYFAKQGKKVTLTPKIDSPTNCYDYERIYDRLIGTKYYGKCPDLLVDDKYFYEHEGFTGRDQKRCFGNMLKHGLKQSNRLVVEDCGLTDGYMLRSIHGRIANGYAINEIWIKNGKDLRLLYKTNG